MKRLLTLLAVGWAAISALAADKPVLAPAISALAADKPALFPANGAVDVNTDTHLVLTFDREVTVGQKGFIRIYNKKTGRMVDQLDLSIPAGPTQGQVVPPGSDYLRSPYVYDQPRVSNRDTKPGTPSAPYPQGSPESATAYQLTIIGGFSDGFHFYPVIVHGNRATIYLHHNLLDYDTEYYVTIDRDVINGFEGIKGKKAWTFRTKAKAPEAQQRHLTVRADGTGDFSTLQGALDFIPDFVADESGRWTVDIADGDYEELVYFRNKNYVSIIGQSREGVRIHYPNNEVFNPHPPLIKTNERPGTFPSRRAAVAADNCRHLILKNLTLKTDCFGQAEGFLINGDHNYAENLHIIGSGDALQANGSAYWMNCIIEGHGDTILGRGPSFFNGCTLTSRGAFMWIRNTADNHGNVFLSCTFNGEGKDAVLARLPDNKGRNYPHAECVLLNCTLNNIPAAGWGPIDESARTARMVEFNSRDAQGNLIDTSRRHSLSRQLHPLTDAEEIARYSDFRYVLNW